MDGITKSRDEENSGGLRTLKHKLNVFGLGAIGYIAGWIGYLAAKYSHSTAVWVAENQIDAITARAIEVIGNRDEALRWLGTPVRALGYATPISKLKDTSGTKEVIAVLAALEQGSW